MVEGALPDYRSQATGDAVSYTQTPAPGTVVPAGSVTVYVEGTDAAGNLGHTYFYVRVVPAAPIRTVLGSKGAPVPGAGVEGSGIPDGAVWATFGVPSINDAGQAVVLGTFKVGSASTTAILGWALADPEDMMVIAKKGGAAPGITNVVMSALKDPLLGPDGSIVWTATLAHIPSDPGAIDTTNNAAIFLDADGAGGGAAFVVAQKGAEADGNAKWKAFTSVALGRNAVAFTASLSGQVTAANDSGLWVYNRTTSTMSLALREGAPLLSSTVKTINALVARPGSPGQGHGVQYDDEKGIVSARVTLADGRQAVGLAWVDGSTVQTAFPYVAGADTTAGYGQGAVWKSFGIPTQTAGALAFMGTVSANSGSATNANNVAIFAEEDGGQELFRITSKGVPAVGVFGSEFATFKDPVSAGNRSVAFHATLKASTAAGINAANNDGIWFFRSPTLSLVARESAQPPEAPLGAQWKAFTSLALPEGRGPIFVATMHSKTGTASPGPGGITTANDTGLWATDSFGVLRLLIREGDAIGASTVNSFTVLSSVVGSPAQTRSFDKTGGVIVKATDLTGAQHLLHIAVP